MRIVVNANMTGLLDADVLRFVRAALRGHRNLFSPTVALKVSVFDGVDYQAAEASYSTGGSLLTLKIPPLTDLEKLANLTKTRPVLPRRITDQLFDLVRVALLPPHRLRDKRVAPDLRGRKNKTPAATLPKSVTKIDKARAKLLLAETRIQKYERLLKRAHRDAAKHRTRVRRLERTSA
jgi:hypothetical protein